MYRLHRQHQQISTLDLSHVGDWTSIFPATPIHRAAQEDALILRYMSLEAPNRLILTPLPKARVKPGQRYR